ncbi:hypothetical protein GGR52DRAFT_213918 [Hypoxylon sp. FL1284]|nr:hypothetical protein GGR52DRAFT_213918 [Hypoxylon sp. FL1284]
MGHIQSRQLVPSPDADTKQGSRSLESDNSSGPVNSINFGSRSPEGNHEPRLNEQSPPAAQRDSQIPEIIFSSQVPHSPDSYLPIPPAIHDRRHEPRHQPQHRAATNSTSPVYRARLTSSPAMDSSDEIAESPQSTQAPATTHKAEKRKLLPTSHPESQRSSSVDGTTRPSPDTPDAVDTTPKAQTKKRKRHRKSKAHGSSELGASSEVGYSSELDMHHANGNTARALLENAVENASSSKKRKNAEASDPKKKDKRPKHGHESYNFSNLAESLYEAHTKERSSSNQRDASRDRSDSEHDANSVDQDAGDRDDLGSGSDGDQDEGEHDTEDNPSAVLSHSTPTPRRRAGKRFVKPTFYEEAAQEEAGPSKTPASTKTKQPKISSLLKSNSKNGPRQSSSSPQPQNAATSQRQPLGAVSGAFTEFELRNISHAVERWREDHNLTQAEVNNLIQGNPKEVRSQDFWARVVATCPNRKRQKIINQTRRKFHNFVARGTWTPEQQEELQQMYETHGTKYSVIGKLINRHPEDVRDRVRNYVVCGQSRRVDPWSAEEEELLHSIVTIALQDIREQMREANTIHDKGEEDLIDWQLVSERMNRTRSRLQCIQKWKIMLRQKQAGDGSIDGAPAMTVDEIIEKARDEAESLLNEDRYRLVKAIRERGVLSDSRIPWANIRETKMHSRWPRPTLLVAWYRLKISVPDWEGKSSAEIAKRLSKTYRQTNTLDFADESEYDPRDEHRYLASRINKILQYQRKLANSKVKEEDEDDEDDDSHDQEEEKDSEDDKSINDQANDADSQMKDGADDESDDNASSSQSSRPAKPTKSRKQRSSSEQAKKSSSGRKKTASKKVHTKRKTQEVAEESSEDESHVQQDVEDDEVSSDTNASEASSIPAHL